MLYAAPSTVQSTVWVDSVGISEREVQYTALHNNPTAPDVEPCICLRQSTPESACIA